MVKHITYENAIGLILIGLSSHVVAWAYSLVVELGYQPSEVYEGKLFTLHFQIYILMYINIMIDPTAYKALPALDRLLDLLNAFCL